MDSGDDETWVNWWPDPEMTGRGMELQHEIMTKTSNRNFTTPIKKSILTIRIIIIVIITVKIKTLKLGGKVLVIVIAIDIVIVVVIVRVIVLVLALVYVLVLAIVTAIAKSNNSNSSGNSNSHTTWCRPCAGHLGNIAFGYFFGRACMVILVILQHLHHLGGGIGPPPSGASGARLPRSPN